ncbi:hypothetical protein Q428_14810 [Fervidicella metallireducens AeB]|uniref:DUF3805 domain-containing protein n=1 Tax=Fervidicella metallireducens AeB TaxID=1403537 RepID=A0A017RRG2_9CLOT|nr:hypothetical protein [Fervidicella metallireducens]EYE87176.1 hypothetical protein Q428_14810 [Fervidicella metallireducens AeB]
MNDYLLDVKGWFEMEIPEGWCVEQEENIINIFLTTNPQGVLQISFHTIDEKVKMREYVIVQLKKFIENYNIICGMENPKVMEKYHYTYANASGFCEEDYIEIWTVGYDTKFLLITYISPDKTDELICINNIVSSIRINTDN